MPRYIAFLRAVNVGGRVVKMEVLRELFAALGHSKVETFIASGNVVFDSPSGDSLELERKIEERLLASLGYKVATLIRSTAELTEVACYKPFLSEDMSAGYHALYVVFLQTVPSEAACQAVLALRTEFDEFHVCRRELYWLCRQKVSDSKITGALLERKLGMPATSRNSTTVRKLAAKYPVL